jgi:hypothetical protein
LRDAGHALEQQGQQVVFDTFSDTMIGEASGEAFGQFDRPVRRADQRCPGIRNRKFLFARELSPISGLDALIHVRNAG